jgi:hypothetical protein
MTYDVWHFALTSIETGRLLALGVICPDAHYVGRLGLPAPNTPRTATLPGVDRRHASEAEWADIVQQLGVGLNPGPLPRVSPAYQVLAGDLNATIACLYMSRAPIEFKYPYDAPAAVDRSLTGQVEAYLSSPEKQQ